MLHEAVKKRGKKSSASSQSKVTRDLKSWPRAPKQSDYLRAFFNCVVATEVLLAPGG